MFVGTVICSGDRNGHVMRTELDFEVGFHLRKGEEMGDAGF